MKECTNNLYIVLFACCMSFSSLQDTDNKKLDELVKLLANDDPLVRDKAQSALESFLDTDTKAEILKKLISNAEPEVKVRAETVITNYERKKSGKILFRKDDQLWIMNIDGSLVKQLTQQKGNKYNPVCSPDGSKVAYLFSTGGGKNQIHIIDLESGKETELTASEGFKSSLCFTPDSKQIFFIDDLKKSAKSDFVVGEVCTIDVATKEVKKLTSVAKSHSVIVDPSGKKLFTVKDSSHEIYTVDIDGKNKKLVTDSKRSKSFLTCSQDGNKLAYVSHDSNKSQSEIFVVNVDGSGEKQITSSKFAHREGLIFTKDSKSIICCAITIFS